VHWLDNKVSVTIDARWNHEKMIFLLMFFTAHGEIQLVQWACIVSCEWLMLGTTSPTEAAYTPEFDEMKLVRTDNELCCYCFRGHPGSSGRVHRYWYTTRHSTTAHFVVYGVLTIQIVVYSLIPNYYTSIWLSDTWWRLLLAKESHRPRNK